MENLTNIIKQENVDMETEQKEYSFESVEVGNYSVKEEILSNDESETEDDNLESEREGDVHEQGDEDEHDQTKTMEFTYVKAEEDVDDNW